MQLTRIAGAVLLMGCGAASQAQHAPADREIPKTTLQPKAKRPMQQKFQDIDSLQALIGMDQQAFVERFGIQANQIRSGATFERLENLVEIHNPELGQVWFYFRDGKLLAIDWTDDAMLKQIDGKALIERFGKSGTWMRSRAGKSHNLRAWPEKGIAVSLAGAECDYIHLFKPMPKQEYENSFYKDPGAFVR